MKKMKALLLNCPRPYVQPIKDGECGQKKEGGIAALLLPEAKRERTREQSALCGKAATGQTPGPLIDLHYVNHCCDTEHGMKNGSHGTL